MNNLLEIILIYGSILCFIGGLALFKFNRYIWDLRHEKYYNVPGHVITREYVKKSRIGGLLLMVSSAVMFAVAIYLLVEVKLGFTVVTIEGKNFTLPCSYEDIQAIGYHIEEGQEIETLTGSEEAYKRKGVTYTVVNDRGRKFEIRFENDTSGKKLATECKIYEMSFEYASPDNPYDGMMFNYTNNYLADQLGLSPEELEQANSDYIDYINEQSDYVENYEILNSPKIALSNGINSAMSKTQVVNAAGSGSTPNVSVASLYYDETREYSYRVGYTNVKVSITYVSGGKIAKIHIER